MADLRRERIWTYTGRQYHPFDPQPDDVDIRDIARATSMLARYTGHLKRFYSVAEHSEHVSHMVPAEHALCGLLHDSTEAYLNDLSRPFKYGLPQYREVEALNWRAIAIKFGLPFDEPAEVKAVDNLILWIEAAQVLAIAPPGQWGHIRPLTQQLPKLGRLGISPRRAEARFLRRYRELTGSATLWDKVIISLRWVWRWV